QVEDDELDRDEVVAHVELHARVLECLEAALVGRQLLRVRTAWTEHAAHDGQRNADPGGHDQEQQGRQVLGQHVWFSLASARGSGRGLAGTAGAGSGACRPRRGRGTWHAWRGPGKPRAGTVCIAWEL